MAPVKEIIKFEWRFSCTHIMKQDDPTVPSSLFLKIKVLPMDVLEPCVYCNQFKPTIDFKKSKAQNYKEDQEVLNNDKNIMDALQMGIDDAPGNAEILETNTKMMDTFKLSRANQIVKIEKSGNGGLVQPGHSTSLCTAIQKKIQTALAKTKILHQAEVIRLERARKAVLETTTKSAWMSNIPTAFAFTITPTSTNIFTSSHVLSEPKETKEAALIAEKLEIRCKTWEGYLNRIKNSGEEVLGSLEGDVLDGSWGNGMIVAEKDIQDTWVEVVRLMAT
ncbi:hypothetical protein WAI453_008063 [Rhynchosporium graminicola]